MTFNNNFKIKALTIADYSKAEIIDVSATRSYGRRFKLKIDGVESKEYIFRDIIKKAHKLAKMELKNPQMALDDVFTISNICQKFFEAEEKAQEAYNKREFSYRFCTWFLRLFTFKDPLEKISDLSLNITPKFKKRSPLIHSILFDDINALKTHLQSGLDCNVPDRNGRTPLMHSVVHNRKEMMELLLDHGADCNLVDEDGHSALRSAAIHGQKEMMELLLDHGADCNLVDEDGNSALLSVAVLGKKKIVESLLDHGADCNLVNKDGKSALTLACVLKNKEIVESLLDHGADPMIASKEGFTPFHSAKWRLYKEITDLFKNSISQNELLLQKELLLLNILGNSTHLAGTSLVQELGTDLAAKSISLEGGQLPYFLKQMRNATQLIPSLYPGLIDNVELSQLIDFFNSGIDNPTAPTQDQIFVKAGFLNHGVAAMGWGPYFILNNRGDASRKAVEVFRYDRAQLTPEILAKINDARTEDLESYKKLFFEELPATLKFEPQGDFEKALENLATEVLPMQTVGNCAWASSEAAVFSFFALSKLSATSPSVISEQDAAEIKNKYHTWLAFVQTYQLERYLEGSAKRRKAFQIDGSVVKLATQAIRSTVTKVQSDEQLIQRLNSLGSF